MVAMQAPQFGNDMLTIDAVERENVDKDNPARDRIRPAVKPVV
ncbi:MAG: hypothetical protein NVSMB31_18090 [Vulcanimicrobiaceae bacterium]